MSRASVPREFPSGEPVRPCTSQEQESQIHRGPVTSGPPRLTPFSLPATPDIFQCSWNRPNHPQPRQDKPFPLVLWHKPKGFMSSLSGCGYTHSKLSPAKAEVSLGILLWCFPSLFEKNYSSVQFVAINHFKPENGFVLKTKSKQNVLAAAFK